jgi:hypothetical protein
LGYVALYLRHWGNGFEWVLEMFGGLLDALLEDLDGLNPVVDLSQLEVTFVCAVGVLLDGLFQNLLSLLGLVILLQDIGIAHDHSLIERVLLVRQTIEVLSLIIVELFLLFFSQPEQLLER